MEENIILYYSFLDIKVFWKLLIVVIKYLKKERERLYYQLYVRNYIRNIFVRIYVDILIV